jgi:hypothetical protein
MAGAGHIQPNPDQLESLSQAQTDIIEYTKARLGDSMIDLELNKEDYSLAIKQALIRYRQRAEHSVEESFAFLDLVPDTQEYFLPKEVMSVKQIFRRGLGGLANATQFEPFSSGFLNTYMLVAGRVGGLINYELFVDYQKLTMTMFGGYITFNYNEATKKLVIHRRMPGESSVESVLLWIYNYKPDQVILNDTRSFPWIQDYAYAFCKYSLGEAREKYATINGPQGGSSLNGTAMKAEAKAEMDQLIVDLGQYVDGSVPLSFIIG